MSVPENVRMSPVTFHLPTDLLKEVDEVIGARRHSRLHDYISRGEVFREAIDRWAKEQKARLAK